MMPRNSSPIIEKELVCSYQIRLEKVLGVTVSNNAALTSDNTGIIAYPAGCTVVLFNTVTERQSHIINVNRKTITSLAFSSCGRYIVTGECGHQPAVRVWDLQSDLQSQHPGLTPQPQQIAEFLGHKYGVNCVAFSPTTKYVVSIGTQHDMIVNVWDWKNNIKVASNKVSTKVKSIAFADNGSYFVTVGNRHVKFWYLEQEKRKYKEAVPLMGRSAILGEQRNNYFCDVACGKADSGDSTYAITRSGLLCEFNNRRLLDKWVELRTSSANCIAVGEKYIFVGCAEGIIRCFDPQLRFVTTLPRTHYLGVDVSLGTNITHMGSSPDNAKYPDAVALTYDEANSKLTCVYNDHSIYVWDVTSIRRVGKSHSFLFHSACIWGVETAPSGSPLPDGTFLTCSSDDTVRFWSLDAPDNASKSVFPQNIYSKELMKVLYIDKELAYLKDLDISGTTNNEKTQESSSYDGRNGVRCIRISPDGKSLASGDRSGNIRVHEMATMKETLKIEAHDAEVLCLEYSPNDPSFNLMASASRDRLIHVFDVKRGYDFVQTLDDHSSSITAVRFLKNTKNLQMVSCGADKSLIFRSLTESDNGKVPQFVRDHNASGKTTLYDMEVDTGQKHVLTACQDRNVRIYSVNNGKHTKSFKGSSGDEGTLIKVVLDRSGIFLATSCTDKSLSVYDYYSGECMATMCGHSELATGLRFTNDCRRLISASGDGCIFVWRVPHDMVITMHARLTQQAMRLGKPLDTRSLGNRTDDGDADATTDANYRFSIGQLPKWAKRQFTEEGTAPPPQNKNVAAPKGRWAQRAETTLGAKSGVYSISPFASIDRRLDGSDGSKDSSLDSGTDLKNYSEFKREIHTATSMQKFSNVTLRSDTRRSIMTDDSAIGDVESTAHDGDIDSDNEYRYRPLYYPTQADSASGSEFTVTNMDQDELRKSQRKKKPPTINLTAANVPYGSNESDEDDDDASTPSGDNTDRNPMSLLSVSSESLDHLVSREKYLQSTFESMSGAENEQTPTNKTSISSKFLRTGERNVEAINAVKMTKNDPDAMRTRQELHKRIADTKKKLESVGHGSPLKYSQSIHDLSHIPVRDTWNNKKQGNDDVTTTTNTPANTNHHSNNDYPYHYHHNDDNSGNVAQSSSVPNNLQLCGCLMQDIERNTTHLSNILSLKSPERTLDDLIRPRKLKLDKTLAKYKLNKSLPVSPVSEERQFSDYADSNRKSFSYFVDLQDTDASFKKVCSDIEQFSKDFSVKYDQIASNVEIDEEDGNFSSDSLEDYSFRSVKQKPSKKQSTPRRCMSNNEIYALLTEDPPTKSESFYLNQHRTSQDSILSDDNLLDCDNKSRCTSMESILSNESDCKSAPLEVLFNKPERMLHSQSVPKNLLLSQSVPKEYTYDPSLYNYNYYDLDNIEGDFKRSKSLYNPSTSTTKSNLRSSQTQTDFVAPLVKKNVSADFQRKLLKFESTIAQSDKKPVAFFIENTSKENVPMNMYIPSLASKNKQYKSKYCNVLNNKPEFNMEIYEESGNYSVNFEKTKQKNKVIQETSSLDRHLFAKSLFTSEKITHKPPKSVRRHSSKTKKTKTSYEYVKKEDFYSNKKLNNALDEKTIEFSYKEKNIETDLEMSNRQQSSILNELYDSLDKNIFSSKNDLDSLEVNLNTGGADDKIYDSLESNLWSKTSTMKIKKTPDNKIQLDLENIKILNEIQRKIQKINNLIDVFKKNVTCGKVRALSSLYESLHNSQSYYNDLTKLQTTPIKFRRRNLSLPSFVERRLNFDTKPSNVNVRVGDSDEATQNDLGLEVYVSDEDDKSLRRSCSLVDLSMTSNSSIPARKLDSVSGKKSSASRMSTTSRYQKNSSSSMQRSRSTTVLNASDSENDSNDKSNKISRLMRPTISSHNKMNSLQSKALNSRKKQSYSTSNLSTVGVENISTSDDDIDSKKPTAPPRTRSGNYENNNMPHVTPRKHLNNNNNKEKSKASRHTIHFDTTITNDDFNSIESLDLSSIEISNQLCDDTIKKLTKAAENVVQLYGNLMIQDGGDSGAGESQAQIDRVKMSIIRTHKILHDCILTDLRQSNSNIDVNQTDAVKKLNDLVAKSSATSANSVVNVMEQYSDILLDMVQQKIHSSNI